MTEHTLVDVIQGMERQLAAPGCEHVTLDRDTAIEIVACLYEVLAHALDVIEATEGDEAKAAQVLDAMAGPKGH